jgi:hypothetical protein
MTKAITRPDVGNLCYLRHCTVLAPLKKESRLLFIGHTPPPARQWVTSAICGRNPTIRQVQALLKSDIFLERLVEMGLAADALNPVKLNAANILPLVGVSTKPMGSPETGHGFVHYQSDRRAQEKNASLLRRLVREGGYDVILIGWGRLSDSLSPFSKWVVEYLREHAESRTLIFCSIGHEEPGSNWRKTYPGHPRGGFKRGIAAQPLSAYRRFRLPSYRQGVYTAKAPE